MADTLNHCEICGEPSVGAEQGHRLCPFHLNQQRRAKYKKRKAEKQPSASPYGVDAPITRMALALINLATGALPKGFDERWKDRIPPT